MKPSLYDRAWAFFWCDLRFVRAWSYLDPVYCHRYAMRRSVLMMLRGDAAEKDWHATAVWIAMREDWPGWRAMPGRYTAATRALVLAKYPGATFANETLAGQTATA